MPTNVGTPGCRKRFTPMEEPRRSSTLNALASGIDHIFSSGRLDERIEDAMLDPLLRMWTEIDGKYTTRFRSTLIFTSVPMEIEHEHVWTRSDLKRLLRSADSALWRRAYLDHAAVGCVVAKFEHEKLTRLDRPASSGDHFTGWDRYDELDITVVDMATGLIITGALRGFGFDIATNKYVRPAHSDEIDDFDAPRYVLSPAAAGVGQPVRPRTQSRQDGPPDPP